MMSIPYQAFAGNQQAQWASQAAQERNNYLANYYAQQTPIQPPTPLTEEEKEEIERKREEEEEAARVRVAWRERENARIAAAQAAARAVREKVWGNPRNRYTQLVFDKVQNSLYCISKILKYIILPAGSIIIFVKIKNIIDNENETKQLKWKKEWSNCTEWNFKSDCSENNCDWVCDENTCTWDGQWTPSDCDFDSPTWETNCWGKCIAPLYDDDTSWFGWVLLIVLGYIIVLFMLYAIIYKVCMKRHEYAVKKSKKPSFNITHYEEQQALIYKDGDVVNFYAPEPLECAADAACLPLLLPSVCCPNPTNEECEKICCMCIIPTLIFAGVIGLIILVMYTTSHPMG